MKLLHAPQTGHMFSVVAGPKNTHFSQKGKVSVADFGARWVPAAAPFGDASCSLHGTPSASKFLGSVSAIRIWGLKSENRAGQNGARYAWAKPEGSSEKSEYVQNTKAESASNLDDSQEPFRDAVESGQSIGEATTQLQFEAKEEKEAGEAIRDKSEELFKQSTTNGNSEVGKCKSPEHQDPKAEVSSEIWAEKDPNEENATSHSFLDDEKKVDFHGEEDKSVLGIGGERVESS
ncbi:uncharacterized protein [Physcomitrium patens]|uniref:Uncharacterized protein n=1 Tax=Physcomitrium patens TaxID=3218 RepID=A0A2K1L1V5_PHYPA|nr:uncharacterized protein LOC112292840 isoform X2 [Physcomitrium patens]PNR60008.1 hypothetical protein PHYPA_002800 [Physcomitrium patens]|eukprot:XP_024397493.1 uncharacterized protein LOC112292840 isoform X2 [Physcomitrella patens]